MSVYFTLTGAQRELEKPTYCDKCGSLCVKSLRKKGEHFNGKSGELVEEFRVAVRCPQHRGWLSGGPFSSHAVYDLPYQGTPFS